MNGSNEPLWPFGFGMSYTTFRVDNLRLDRDSVPVDGEFAATVDIENLGRRWPSAGDRHRAVGSEQERR